MRSVIDARQHYVWVDSVDGIFLFRSAREAVDYAAEHLQRASCAFWRGSLVDADWTDVTDMFRRRLR